MFSRFQNSEWRHELKFFTSISEAKRLEQTLTEHFHIDGHSIQKTYKVSSLYFETAAADFAFEKLSGTFYRKKFRLRTYGANTCVPKRYKFEMKVRKGNLIGKKSLLMEQAWPIHMGDLMSALPDGPEKATFIDESLSKCLVPSVVVSYKRRAFSISSKVRLTLDFNIRADAANHFSWKPAISPVTDADWVVVEVKYPFNMMPEFAWSILENYDLRRTSSSKFLMAQRLVRGQRWADQ